MFERSFWTEGDLRTSAREWTWPEEEWTTIMDWRRGFREGVVVVAREEMCFWKPAAVKPGEARRMGFEEMVLLLELELEVVDVEVASGSSWRRRVSRVVW